MGEKEVTEKLHISGDNTHTTEAGARLNAETVAQAMGKLKGSKLKRYAGSKQE
jgi:hypothetical protein